jgi:hypothetical protein
MIEWVGIEVIAEHQIRGKNSGRSYSNVKRHGVVDLSAAAAVVWQVGGFGPMPHHLSHFLTDDFLTIDL